MLKVGHDTSRCMCAVYDAASRSQWVMTAKVCVCVCVICACVCACACVCHCLVTKFFMVGKIISYRISVDNHAWSSQMMNGGHPLDHASGAPQLISCNYYVHVGVCMCAFMEVICVSLVLLPRLPCPSYPRGESLASKTIV